MSDIKIMQLFAGNALKDNICRLCLKESENFFNIFETDCGNNKPISDMLEVLISVKLNHREGYPKVVCNICLDRAIVVSEFKIKCAESNAILDKCYQMFNRNNEDADLPFDEDDNIVNTENISDCVQCKLCRQYFCTSSRLQEHLDTFIHKLQCKICKKVCTSKKKLFKHYERHKKSKEIVCPFCDGLIKNSKHSDDFKFICHYCDFKYPCKLFLENHISLEHVDGVVCKRTANNDNIILNGNHDDTSENKCSECDRNFKTLRYLNLHKAASNCKYVCDYCDVVYKFKDQLKLHIMTKHINYKPYRCDVCHKTFALKTILKSHSVVHTKERKFQCDYCGKSFVCNVTLRYHRRLHTGERPYRCAICGEGFVNTSRLRDHEQVKHIGRVQCPTCLRTFTKRSTLKNHMDNLHPNTYVKGQKYLMFNDS